MHDIHGAMDAMIGFEETHREYLRCWEAALRTGDCSGVERFLSPRYHGWFAPNATDTVPYDHDEAITGMQESVNRLRGTQLQIAHRTVSGRGDDEAVACYEKSLLQGNAVVASSVIVEAWRREEGSWLLERELTEHGASVRQLS